MINEATISLVNEQFNEALRMTKEMNHVCASVDNAMFNMNTLRRDFESNRSIAKDLTLKHAQNNMKLAETKTLLAKYLEGSVEDRIHALAEEYNSTSGPKYSLLYASNYVDIENEQAELKKEIDKYETAANNEAKLIGSCHFAIKDLYVKFKNSIAEANRQKEAMAKKQAEVKPKTIKIIIDTSHLDLRNLRFVQQAYDTLNAFLKHAEVTELDEIKLCDDILKEFKKGVEKEAEKDFEKTMKEKGIIFKLSTAE